MRLFLFILIFITLFGFRFSEAQNLNLKPEKSLCPPSLVPTSNACDWVTPFPWIWQENDNYFLGKKLRVFSSSSGVGSSNTISSDFSLFANELKVNSNNIGTDFVYSPPTAQNDNKQSFSFFGLFDISDEKLTIKKRVETTNNYLVSNKFFQLSDKNFKKDIKPITASELEEFNKLNAYEFVWADNNLKDFGFVAQEIEKSFPSLIATSEENVKFLNYDALSSFLIENIKVQDDLIKQRDSILKEINNLTN